MAGRSPQPQWDNLSTEQQEATCAEFLRLQRKIEELPRLRYLLLSVGRTLEDVDVYGLAEDDREIFAQVTFLSRDHKLAQEKIERLEVYGSDDTHLVFFGAESSPRQEKGVVFVSIDEVWGWIDDRTCTKSGPAADWPKAGAMGPAEMTLKKSIPLYYRITIS